MPDVRPTAPATIRTLPSWLLGRAAARGHRLVAAALARAGLRMTHHAVLASVAERGPVSQAELGRSLAMDPKDVVVIVGDLERAGLVSRAPDAEDRRKKTVALTPEGRRRLRQTERLGREANDELTAALTPAEREHLLRLLTRLVQPDEPCATRDRAGD